MKFLENRWVIIAIAVIVIVLFHFMGKCTARQEITGLLKANEDSTKILQKAIDDLVETRKKLDKSIAGYNESQARTLEEIAVIEKEIIETKKKIGEIPSKKVFTDLADCNRNYATLHATATAQGELIIKYEADISKYKLFVENADKKELDWVKMKENFESEITKHKTKIEMDKELIEELSKKNHQKLLVASMGGYWDPIKERYGVAVCFGVNLYPMANLIKKIF